MNREDSRVKPLPERYKTLLHLRGASYTIEEAWALAMSEMHRRNFQAAADLFSLILTVFPDNAAVFGNRGVAWHELKRYEEALADFNQVIALKPSQADVYNNRGVTLQELQQYAEALASFDKALALAPDHAEACSNRGMTLQRMERDEEALVAYDRAIALNPGLADAHYNRGMILQKMKLYDDALASYSRAIALRPSHADSYHRRGLVLVNIGNMPEAERMFQKAYALKPDFAENLSNLIGIRKYQDPDHVDRKHVQALLNRSDISLTDRECLYFCLGKIYDDCGCYDEAFECYRQANQLRNTTVSYNPKEVTELTDNLIEVFSKEFLAQPFAFASDSQLPLLVVGMPRSGTTLLASILSNHRSVASAGELTTIIDFTSRLPELVKNRTPYPQAVKQLTPDMASRLISDYEKRLRRDVGPDVLRVVDKHPINFRHLGLISMLFPRVQIIHCTRHPLDTCLSNYFQRFSKFYDYSFDLGNIAHFYREYLRTMEHWRKVLPARFLEISYEDTIVNTEQVAHKMLDFIGLDWDERCLAPHTNPTAVETASQWQVRQPIYRQSVERWHHYEKHLTALKKMLQLNPPA